MRAAERVAEIADRIERDMDGVVAAMTAAILATVPSLGDDEAIRADMEASSRGNVRRYLAMARQVDDPPPPEVPPEALDFARTVVRRGIEVDAVYQGYRQGQQALWRRWMAEAEAVARSGEELAQVLSRSLELLFAYVDDVLGRVIAEIQREREQVLGGALARRAETVRLLLDGAPLDPAVASDRLQHDLARPQTALVVWRDGPATPGTAPLEDAANAFARVAGVRRPLTLVAGTRALWAWLPGPPPARDAPPPPLDPQVRIAVGPTIPGVTGFRRSHEAALDVQRLQRRNPAGGPIATYEELEITALAAHDEQRAAAFVAATLGPLADDTPSAARVRETLRVWLEEAEHAPRAAARLHLHRNTVLQRVAKATELLGHRPGERRLAVELALELHRRLGPPGGR